MNFMLAEMIGVSERYKKVEFKNARYKKATNQISG